MLSVSVASFIFIITIHDLRVYLIDTTACSTCSRSVVICGYRGRWRSALFSSLSSAHFVYCTGDMHAQTSPCSWQRHNRPALLLPLLAAPSGPLPVHYLGPLSPVRTTCPSGSYSFHRVYSRPPGRSVHTHLSSPVPSPSVRPSCQLSLRILSYTPAIPQCSSWCTLPLRVLSSDFASLSTLVTLPHPSIRHQPCSAVHSDTYVAPCGSCPRFPDLGLWISPENSSSRHSSARLGAQHRTRSLHARENHKTHDVRAPCRGASNTHTSPEHMFTDLHLLSLSRPRVRGEQFRAVTAMPEYLPPRRAFSSRTFHRPADIGCKPVPVVTPVLSFARPCLRALH
ncbi:hypothetical protein PYCCODRAFT_759876 [Trametes coccinea BRFM310]|uniref:Uncharacterized protein n=1 Tax=Trametes coccinea (strain BRFM310) TaxID=1353009 RepID=A0A1Y2J1R5_TRAC3|nr:hypothetical protein PYCCODRAFT_759876 [Trametes coccinea BRFM310]